MATWRFHPIARQDLGRIVDDLHCTADDHGKGKVCSLDGHTQERIEADGDIDATTVATWTPSQPLEKELPCFRGVGGCRAKVLHDQQATGGLDLVGSRSNDSIHCIVDADGCIDIAVSYVQMTDEDGRSRIPGEAKPRIMDLDGPTEERASWTLRMHNTASLTQADGDLKGRMLLCRAQRPVEKPAFGSGSIDEF